jgi:hypothetical protein
MRAVRLHPLLASFLLAVGSAALAFLAAIAVDAMGMGTLAVSVVAAAVIALAYAVRPVDGLLGFGLVLLLTETVAFWTGVDVRYGDEVGVLLLGVTALAVHRRRLVLPHPGWREAALGTFFVAGIVSSFVQSVPLHVWLFGLGLLAKGFVFLYLVIAMPVSVDEVRRMSIVALGVTLFILGLGAVEFLAPDFATQFLGVFPYDETRGSIQIVNSWFTEPGLYGWLAVFVSLFLLGQFVVLRRAWALVLALVVGGAAVLSGRRTPVIGLIVGLGAAVLHQALGRHASWRTWAAIGAGVLLLAAVSIPAIGGFYAQTISDYLGRPAAIWEVFDENPRSRRIAMLQPRVALYAGSAAIALDKMPLGVGIGRYGSHMSREEYSPVYKEYRLHRTFGLRERRPIAVTDTFWPMVLGETGAIGFIGAVGFFALLLRDSWRAARPTGSPEVTAFTLGALMIFVEALVRSAAAPVFVAPPIAFWAFGAIGLALALRAGETTAASESTASSESTP